MQVWQRAGVSRLPLACTQWHAPGATHTDSASARQQCHNLCASLILTPHPSLCAASKCPDSVARPACHSPPSPRRPACRLTGYKKRQLVGSNISMLVPPPMAAMHDGFLLRYHRTRTGRYMNNTRPVVMLTSQGVLRLALLSLKEAAASGGARGGSKHRTYMGVLRETKSTYEYAVVCARCLGGTAAPGWPCLPCSRTLSPVSPCPLARVSPASPCLRRLPSPACSLECRLPAPACVACQPLPARSLPAPARSPAQSPRHHPRAVRRVARRWTTTAW